jgi:flagellar motor switch protein FliN/FliY
MTPKNESTENPEAANPASDGGLEGGKRSLDMLLDVPLQVTVELGRRRMRIGDLLALAKGSVVELDKVAGEPLDVRVNDQLVARGEAVVVNDKFGVRLTDVVSTRERVRGLS